MKSERKGIARLSSMRDAPSCLMMREDGIALLTMVLLLIGLTIVGIAAMTVTGMENRMAGFGRTTTTAASAAEACLGTAVKIIQDTIDQGQLPAA